jgi:hypothetical protein
MVRSTAGSAAPTSAELSDELIEQLRVALKSLRFGSVELTVHEGAVVQIERREKVRIVLRQP